MDPLLQTSSCVFIAITTKMGDWSIASLEEKELFLARDVGGDLGWQRRRYFSLLSLDIPMR